MSETLTEFVADLPVDIALEPFYNRLARVDSTLLDLTSINATVREAVTESCNRFRGWQPNTSAGWTTRVSAERSTSPFHISVVRLGTYTACSTTRPLPTPASGADSIDGTSSPVEALRALERRLGLPLQRLLRAARIRRRTFYSWEASPTICPRVESSGRLWSMLHCVEDLELVVDNLPQWLREPARLSKFEAGRFDELVELAVYEQRRPLVAWKPASYEATDDYEVEWESAPPAPVVRQLPRDAR